MTPCEQAAYLKGILDAREFAMVAAITIEAREVRQQAAAAALHGLAGGLKQLVPQKPATGA
ncbi:hypothetical protein [Methylobacterium sp. CM6247]